MAGLRETDIAGGSPPMSDPSSPLSWQQRLAPYCRPEAARALGQLFSTSLPFLASMATLLYAMSQGVWFALALAVPAAIFLVRLFIIQHDCGHGSFFKSRRVNETLGLVLSVFTMMPYSAWRQAHAAHHANAGNLDQRGTGDVTTLTVREYQSRSRRRRFLYRLYRHPLVLFGVGPAYLLLVRYRVPLGRELRDRHRWLSIVGTDLAAAASAIGLSAIIGAGPFLLAWSTVLLLATSLGVWFFYVQHQFADTYWADGASWEFRTAAIEGSSYYDLPRFLHWLTGSIGFHHIHHLASKVPNYRLRACFDANPEFQRAKRLTLWASIKSVRLALWDEERRELISFRQARRQRGEPAMCRLPS
ncbi:MAG TPA: fatty acid desaturase [Stellaceae bacterium]|jgi:omega-6 fatty acid desaturase (delta-12 desaturase)